MALKRLDRLLGDLGVATRSELRQIIRSGRVRVDLPGRPEMAKENNIRISFRHLLYSSIRLCPHIT